MRPRPHGASVLSGCMSITESPEHRNRLLSGNTLGMGETILLNGRDVGVSPQNLQVSLGKRSSETVDDGPFVRNPGLGADPTVYGGDTNRVINAVLESYDVPSRNGVRGVLDSDERGGGSEDRENTKDERDESVGKHDVV